MIPNRLSDAQLAELSERWTDRFERGLERASFTADELTRLAERQRALARVSDLPGERRALLSTAERFEQVARSRVAAPQ